MTNKRQEARVLVERQHKKEQSSSWKRKLIQMELCTYTGSTGHSKHVGKKGILKASLSCKLAESLFVSTWHFGWMCGCFWETMQHSTRRPVRSGL